jgi:hypothetical protein
MVPASKTTKNNKQKNAATPKMLPIYKMIQHT